MNTFENFDLKTNPFRMTPALNSKELIWAGFPLVKNKFENRIKRSIQIPNSSLVLNWGEYGSGKTHAARYFNKKEVLAKIASEAGGNSVPFSVNVNFPKSKQPVWDIYIQIIDKIQINELREYLKEKGVIVSDILDSITNNYFIQNVIKLMFDRDVDENLFKQYLYKTISNSDLKAFPKEGIQRVFSTDNDLTEFLGALFTVLTYKKKAYSCVVIWFDEFEDISILNSLNISGINNFLKLIVDIVPNNLLIFLNLTQSAMMSISDLSEYLQDAVKSRIKERIELAIPTKEDLKLYLKELLNNSIHRETARDDFYPFNEEVIDALMADLGNVSLRRLNEAFSLLLESAAFEKTDEINLDYYKSLKEEIIGWKE
jgi:archaellum biogenesis ATPase FlaH